jgi:CRISPR type I-E-associated protein CasA/Cse1
MMNMTTYNLTTEPWIPVRWRKPGASASHVSLRDAFAQGLDIADLNCRPHERLALLRLLLAISQAALFEMEGFKEWRALGADSYRTMRSTLEAYLVIHQDGFGLFDAVRPFLQMPGLLPAPTKVKEAKAKPVVEDEEGEDEPQDSAKHIDLIGMTSAQDNTSTLFDGTARTRGLTAPDAALALITFQNFALEKPQGVALKDGHMICRVGGRSPKDGKCGTSAAPCIAGNLIHTFAVGDSLLETVHLNLVPVTRLPKLKLPKDRLGPAPWDVEQVSRWLGQNRSDGKSFDPALSPSFIERLCPVSRFVLLDQPKDGRIWKAVITNGVAYPMWLLDEKGKSTDQMAFQPPSAATYPLEINTGKGATKKTLKKDVFVKAESGKAFWRQAHQVALARTAEEKQSGKPACYHNLNELHESLPDVSKSRTTVTLLAIGALGSQAKLEHFMESTFSLRECLLWQSTTLAEYESGVRFADIWEGRLDRAVEEYVKTLVHMGKNYKKPMKSAASAGFWAQLDAHAQTLLQVVETADQFIQTKTGGIDYWHSANPWLKKVRGAAVTAFKDACPGSTPDQILACAAGLAVLFPKPKKPKKL